MKQQVAAYRAATLVWRSAATLARPQSRLSTGQPEPVAFERINGGLADIRVGADARGMAISTPAA